MYFQSGLSSNMFLANELKIFSAYFLCQDTGIGRLQRLTWKYTVFIKTLLIATWWSNYVTFGVNILPLRSVFLCVKVHETHKRYYNYTDVRVIFRFWLLQSNHHYIICVHSFIHSFIHLFIIRPANRCTINTDHVTSLQIWWHYEKIHWLVQKSNQSYKL